MRKRLGRKNLKNFSIFRFLPVGISVFDWKISDILPILTRETALLPSLSLLTFQVSISVFDLFFAQILPNLTRL